MVHHKYLSVICLYEYTETKHEEQYIKDVSNNNIVLSILIYCIPIILI